MKLFKRELPMCVREETEISQVDSRAAAEWCGVRARDEKYLGTPAGWAGYAGHKEARDLILHGPIHVIEANQYGLIDREQLILAEVPASLNRPFREYGLYPWDAEAWHTPLAHAVKRGRDEIVRLLIERSADATFRLPEGETLSEIAKKAGRREMSERTL